MNVVVTCCRFIVQFGSWCKPKLCHGDYIHESSDGIWNCWIDALWSKDLYILIHIYLTYTLNR